MLPEILVICLTFPLLSLAARPKNAILLSEVQSLTLRGHGAKTTNRRVSAIPQLKCISSRDGSSYGGEDIEWSCSASLPEELKLGSTDVICEGYSSPDDPFVFKGSCGVEYRLILTAKGESRYPDAWPSDGFFSDGSGGTDLSAWLFAIIFVAILGWILYSACLGAQGQRRQPRAGVGHRGGGGGGGGGGGWNPGWGPGDDPPPPYPGTKPSSTQSQGWTPGFWSGLLGGAAAGYMAGGRNQRNDDGRRPYASNWGAGPSGSSLYSPPSGSGGSSSRHESTGFGSTRRR
ncbi:SOCE-associated regulatory factor of calcium homoeostasis domain-containing protein [Hirsutella rhossiliensis]|uniref:Store-operated calcium entry-associated regulatory factor n=1 Tax=Hirsutella rhossiliensis TaxID=111463 RepID=A0A9P8SHN5_9HYPO|nr:SOCE-associated regulatory factor of calcium homoeostasis domain-containing protein [Hirsutella rhossiliensis]KAH0963001.1 SOCE-associated regulatory factor of calcium homoeostasis domain-containing protein [Hirsutella rhossiliensis]